MAENNVIISAEEEAKLLKPIDEYVGKIQKQIDALRVEGSDKVNSLKNQIAIAKENKNLTKEQQELVDFNGSIKIEEQNYIKSDLCIDGIKNKDEIMKYIGRNRITFFSHEEFFLRDILKWEEIIKLLKDNQFEFIV